MKSEAAIAIVGGGPAGALAAERMASAGRNVLLFDEKLAWEKPCGGGVTHKALLQYPFLSNANLGDRRANHIATNQIDACELISPSGRRVELQMRHPVAVFSRLRLNGLLLERAREAGAKIRRERVTRVVRERNVREQNVGEQENEWNLSTPDGEYRASQLILAAGARNPFRAQFLAPIAPDDLMVTAGYFIPNRDASDRPRMQIQFLKGITGYIWIFPRNDHVSAGIAGKMGEVPTAELRRTLERWLEQNGFALEGAQFYSHILPSFRAQTFDTLQVCGEGWAMIGDSAGLVDPITGEGLYHALRSADLCANAILAGEPGRYQDSLEEEILPELRLAAQLAHRFYTGQMLGDSVLEQMVKLTASSASIRDLMSDLFAGIQGYGDLRARLYNILPSVLAQGLIGTIRGSWETAIGPSFATEG